jgi:AraC family transcriptional regulator
MNKPLTTLDYSRRIERVIAHIGENLDADLDLDALAEVACFSRCHFHRIYHGLTGETVADTVRRLRLHRAAGALIESDTGVDAIARQAGYGGTPAFTRAFRMAYGVTPAAYRRQRRLAPPQANPAMQESAMYDVTIRQFEPVRLAALPHRGSYMQIGPVFERLFAWGAGRGLLGAQTRSIGIYYDDPSATPEKELRSDACISIGPDVRPAEPVRVVDLAGGRHAVLRHKGPYAELHRAYRWLFGDWLPQSGAEAGECPCFEEYLNNPRTLPPEEWLTDICLPLAPAR